MIPDLKFEIRKVTLPDIKEVYSLLAANRPYVGLNSRYTYLLLARDFSDTCLIGEYDKKVIAFSSGYIPPARPDTFFSWEIVVHKDYRGNGLQLNLIRKHLQMTGAKFFEGTVNPSNEFCKDNLEKLAKSLGSKLKKKILFSKEDFENDGHEEEVLYRIGPINFH